MNSNLAGAYANSLWFAARSGLKIFRSHRVFVMRLPAESLLCLKTATGDHGNGAFELPGNLIWVTVLGWWCFMLGVRSKARLAPTPCRCWLICNLARLPVMQHRRRRESRRESGKITKSILITAKNDIETSRLEQCSIRLRRESGANSKNVN